MDKYTCDKCEKEVFWQADGMRPKEECGQQYVEKKYADKCEKTSDLLLCPRTFLCWDCAVDKFGEKALIKSNRI